MKLIVNVTDQHIDQGSYASSTSCAVALALTDIGVEQPSVTYSLIGQVLHPDPSDPDVVDFRNLVLVDEDKTFQQWLTKFDQWKAQDVRWPAVARPEPITFEFEVPDTIVLTVKA